MHDLYAVCFAAHQEPNNFDIHERHFFQVQRKLSTVFSQLLLQFLNVLRLKSADQPDGCLTSIRVPLDLQCPPDGLDVSMTRGVAAQMPMQSADSKRFIPRGIAERSGILIIQKMVGDFPGHLSLVKRNRSKL
jgi:hypothetical protein